MREVLRDAVLIAPATVIFVEVLLRSPVRQQVDGLYAQCRQSVHVLRSGRISEHWKEQVLSIYAWRILKRTLGFLFWMGVMFASFLVVYYLVGRSASSDFSIAARLESAESLVSATVIGACYAVLRTRLGRR